MIKRQFYALEHRNRDDISSASSSTSSSSSADVVGSVDSDGGWEEDEEAPSPNFPVPRHKTSEGSMDEEPTSDTGHGASDAEQLRISGDENDTGDRRRAMKRVKRNREEKWPKVEEEHWNQWAEAAEDAENERLEALVDECVLKCGGVLKCRLCIRVICLSENSMRAHLASKRHARSVKQLAEGRLKAMLNSDGEAEEQGETHAERHARVVASVHEPVPKRKKSSGRQRQRKRAKRKKRASEAPGFDKAKAKRGTVSRREAFCKEERSML